MIKIESWFILRTEKRNKDVIQHPAKFPEELVKKCILTFTKEGDKVLDPMSGTGTVNFVCRMIEREGYAIELEEKYYKIAQSRQKQKSLFSQIPQHFFCGDCRNIKDFNIPVVDYILTSPPYWDSLKRSSIRQKKRKKMGLETEYSSNNQNLENIQSYEDFVNTLFNIYFLLKNWLKKGGFLTIIINNVFKEGKVYPLAYNLTKELSKEYTFVGENIWCQDDKPLIALGINNAYVGNRHHVYILNFKNSKKIAGD